MKEELCWFNVGTSLSFLYRYISDSTVCVWKEDANFYKAMLPGTLVLKYLLKMTSTESVDIKTPFTVLWTEK